MEFNFIVAVIHGAIDHIWVLFLAALITFAILRWRKNNYSVGSSSLWVLFGALAFLAIVPNGFYTVFAPAVAETFGEVRNLPDYKALFTADVILVAIGFIGGAIFA